MPSQSWFAAAEAEELNADGTVDITPGTADYVRDTQAQRYETTLTEGVTINSASIGIIPNAADSAPTVITIHGELAPDPAAFSTTVNDLTGRDFTTADVEWSPGSWAVDGSPRDTPSLVAILQEIVDQVGFDGNIVIIFPGDGGSNRRRGQTANSGTEPSLTVDWTGTAPLLKVIDETAAIGDAGARLLGLGKITGDTVALSDSGIKFIGLLRIIADTVATTEAAARILGLAHVINDTLGITEANARARTMLRLVAETVALTEVNARARTMLRLIAETVATSEANARARVMLRTLGDTVALTEANARARAMLRLVAAETVALTETNSRARTMLRRLAETVALVEVRHTVFTRLRIIAETVAIPEAAARATGLFQFVNETVDIKTRAIVVNFIAYLINVKRTIVRFIR